MTEIMPVPRNLSFTVLPAESLGLLCFCRWLNFTGFEGHSTCLRSVLLELTRSIKNHHDDPSHACKYGK